MCLVAEGVPGVYTSPFATYTRPQFQEWLFRAILISTYTYIFFSDTAMNPCVISEINFTEVRWGFLNLLPNLTKPLYKKCFFIDIYY
mgnify:CR=1 FL=1